MGAATPGQVVISLGTSDTLFAAMPEPRTDPNGYGHVFGNPLGGFMSLICFKNGSLARERVRDAGGFGWDQFSEALREAENGPLVKPLPLLRTGPEGPDPALVDRFVRIGICGRRKPK